MTKEWTRNTKTGTQGIVRARYNRISDGKAMIEVDTGRGIRHWFAAHCEEA
jgi:hypothetical protein